MRGPASGKIAAALARFRAELDLHPSTVAPIGNSPASNGGLAMRYAQPGLIIPQKVANFHRILPELSERGDHVFVRLPLAVGGNWRCFYNAAPAGMA
jgi:hypothetical protein